MLVMRYSYKVGPKEKNPMDMYKKLIFCLVFALSVVGQYGISMAAKPDRPRFLNTVYRVGNLDRTIKFYMECFGMKLLSKGYNPEEKHSFATLGFGPEKSHFVLKAIHNDGVDKIDVGTGFIEFGIYTLNVSKMVEVVGSKGGIITREPSTLEGGTTIFADALDPDGYTVELIQTSPYPNPLNRLSLRVTNMDRAINFYQKALGMKLYLKYDVSQYQFTIAQMGYGQPSKTSNLELRYYYGTATNFTRGNGYKLLALSTDDVYKSAEAVKLATEELGGKIIGPPCPIPGTNTNILFFLDPDGWETVLVDNKNSLKEVQKKG